MAVAGNRTRISANDACTTRRWAGFGLLVSAALSTACGGGTRDSLVATPANAATRAPAEPGAPPVAPPPPADGNSEIDALLHDLRVQKDRVDRELARKEQLAVARAEEAETSAPEEEAAPAPAPKTSAPSKPSKKKDAPAAATGTSPAGPRDADQASSDWVGSPCDTACRALASMERSTERICALAGETDTSCASARSMVKASRERVQAGGCWCRSFGPR
jgi:hypothetical protein